MGGRKSKCVLKHKQLIFNQNFKSCRFPIPVVYAFKGQTNHGRFFNSYLIKLVQDCCRDWSRKFMCLVCEGPSLRAAPVDCVDCVAVVEAIIMDGNQHDRMVKVRWAHELMDLRPTFWFQNGVILYINCFR